jgi:predicted phage terminase large subunit-like protein
VPTAADVSGLGIRLPKWIPLNPTEKQYTFLCDRINGIREVLFGGAAGGAKSWALLMAAAQYVDVPGYAALIIRKDRKRLSQPNGLMPVSQEWWRGSAAKWIDDDNTWVFPGGGTISFGYLDTDADKYRYQSGAYQFIGFDELTEFTEAQYRYLFSRLRGPTTLAVPWRMRAASNPGGLGHDWVNARFMGNPTRDRLYLPSKLSDNPHLDPTEYIKSLDELDPVTRRQLLDGDWTARPPGGYFRRDWFDIVDAVPAKSQRVRYWDLASSEARAGTDPDWTAGCRVARDNDNIYYVEDMRHIRGRPLAVEKLVRSTAEADGRACTVYIEREPGASSAYTIDAFQRRVLPEYAVREDKVDQKKVVRAAPVSSQAEAKNIKIVRGSWNAAFLDEVEAFDQGAHDDQVDVFTGAVRMLAYRRLGHLGPIAQANEDLKAAVGSRWSGLG